MTNYYRIRSRGKTWVVEKQRLLWWVEVFQGTYAECHQWMMSAPLEGNE